MPRAGFIALVGRPNVGKSTLLNRILGQKIAIASPKPQTTRNRILGVRNLPEGQLVLVDTPGLHRPTGRGRSRLNKFMIGEALAAVKDVDAVVALVEPELPGAAEGFVLEALEGKPAILAVNKVDTVKDKAKLLPVLDAWGRKKEWAAIVPISAKQGVNLDALIAEMLKVLPEGEPLFPEEMVTDRAERWLAAELIREQVFLLTRQEVPYGVAVTIDQWDDRRKDVMIDATIHVEKENQKRIVVGAGGAMIREIGTRARLEIAKLLDVPVHLKLFVRVDVGWTEDRAQLRELGYESES